MLIILQYSTLQIGQSSSKTNNHYFEFSQSHFQRRRPIFSSLCYYMHYSCATLKWTGYDGDLVKNDRIWVLKTRVLSKKYHWKRRVLSSSQMKFRFLNYKKHIEINNSTVLSLIQCVCRKKAKFRSRAFTCGNIRFLTLPYYYSFVWRF